MLVIYKIRNILKNKKKYVTKLNQIIECITSM